MVNAISATESSMDPSALEIIHYPHPTLRHKSKPVARVDEPLRAVIKQMFPLMYEAKGIGLAANQIDLPLRIFVLNLASDPKEGEELVFINPVINKPKGMDEKEEGCLSMPGVNGEVKRPETVEVEAYNLQGQLFRATIDGLLARAVQHELDHLDGVLFTDKMSETGKLAIRPELYELEVAFDSKRETGEIPDDEQIARRIQQIEADYA